MPRTPRNNIHVCYQCGNTFNRKQRLIDHIPRSSDCGLDINNVKNLFSNENISTIMEIHSKYFTMTSRSFDENKYREVRKLLKEIHATETARLLAVKEEEEKERIRVYETAQAVIVSQQDLLDLKEKEIAALKAHISEQQQQTKTSLKYKRKFEAQLEAENDIADLLSRIHTKCGKTYEFKLSATELAPFSMPNSNGVSDAEFEKIFNVPDTTPDNIIDQYTYMLFQNANERQLVYIQNYREQNVWIMSGNNMQPKQVDKIFLRRIVNYVLREIREHIAKYKGRIALRWSAELPDNILTEPVVIRNVNDRHQLSRDQQTMRLLNILYEHTQFMYIKDHVRSGTKAEKAEINKTVKSSHTCVVALIDTLYRLNKAFTKQKRISDAAILARFC